MASIVTLFRRWPSADPKARESNPALSMLFTGDAHDRERQIRDTVFGFAGPITPRSVDVLKIPHHGSLCSTSVEFYNRIKANVYLVCAKQSLHGLPNLRILEAMVSHTTRQGSSTIHIFSSNPDSLWNMRSENSANGAQSNLNILLSGKRRPGAMGVPSKYNYKCYIFKHRVENWRYDSPTKGRNAGIILLGRDSQGRLVVTANEEWWDIWDEERIKDPRSTADYLSTYRKVKTEA
ncbi:uncharacterized protein H6S33_007160 [Morchella sextelata]|uniref:uncharacterized protein n=1 Tax=Morchella sextelata TaxID=1174677 RepID=UPI001D04826E|nr:uncharacterized protein H6S33_007160 [Morchella sextelata]KAH0604129.1 hypothetical protein H6S33_007160 [Morchella sextelata]